MTATEFANRVMRALHSLPEGIGCFDEEVAGDFACAVHGIAQEALKPPTVPLSDHQRLSERLAQAEREGAEMRSTGPAVCDLAEAVLDHSERPGEVCSAADGRPCEAHRRIRAHRAALSSSLGTGWLQPTEAAELRARAERAEAQLFDLRESFCPAHRKPEHWDNASCEVCLEIELQMAREEAASEVRRAVEEAVAKEREAVAQMVEGTTFEPEPDGPGFTLDPESTMADLAAAIRSRGKA